ncbi:hypothetical protein CI109_103999 [Kwoniella shandongensis]|uniref:Uncharacterized protein n=1 Tax=Kwoniella shandongensis TaxID=1734106 RepID=A0A5M6BXJ2_9TREE|nr:uncharacterized protein CI109_004116 [Kwoniella shandongensis]KAA5527577.1 hypothetical protein CI109_004116 [Kwoniella shandongensis]
MDITKEREQQEQEPHNLAEATAVDITPFIDPALTGGSDFFPDHVDVQDQHPSSTGVVHHANDDVTNEPTQEDIDAVIKASLDHAQAQAQAEAEAEGVTTDPSIAGVGVSVSDVVFGSGSSPNTPDGQQANTGSTAKSRPNKRPKGEDAKPGEEDNPLTDETATIYLAPFSKPERGIDTPFPEHYLFQSRTQFEKWLEGESSWCHFVQRRTTTPDKRSAERLQARIRAYQRSLEAMTPEEKALTAPLKTRRRNRVSPVLEKVTYTCHHAGSYESKHSTTLPKEKLRLNTKKSVKCACASRIVMSEIQSGECRVVYHWKHEGHDPFTEFETDGGRLPKVIDDWLNTQIEAGKTLDDIRKVLTMTDEEKESYLQKIAADPTTVDPSMPPALALAQKVKYPDLYNRYRKLKGPVKENKVLKGAMKRTASGSVKRSASRGVGVVGEGAEESQGALDEGGVAKRVATTDALISLDRFRSLADADGQKDGQAQVDEQQSSSLNNNNEAHPDTQDGVHDDFSQLAAAASNEGLARALLALPSGGGLRDEDGHEMSLEEAMRRMADDVEVVGQGEEGLAGIGM